MPRASTEERLKLAIRTVREQLSKGELPPEQRAYARLAINLAEHEVGGFASEVRQAENWLLAAIKPPSRKDAALLRSLKSPRPR